MSTSKFDQLLSFEPYGMDPSEKAPLLLGALKESMEHHVNSCPAYKRYLENRGITDVNSIGSLEDIPFISVQAFKRYYKELGCIDESQARAKLQSSATSGVPSTVLVDKLTAKRQVKALAKVMSATMGGRRRPFGIVDADATKYGSKALGARNAAVRGFLNLASSADYLMKIDSEKLSLDDDAAKSFLSRAEKETQSVALFGFTFVIFESLVKPLYEAGKSFQLPKGSVIAHIGGWKKLESQKVPKSEFNRICAKVFGIEESDVIDFYGFTEQMGVTYPSRGNLPKCVSAFSEVIVRDPSTLLPVPDGQPGLLQFLTPLPASYAGASVLTDDVGKIISRDKGDDNRLGTKFEILGRAKKAEVRGCGDILATKLSNGKSDKPLEVVADRNIYVLYRGGKSHAPCDVQMPIELTKLPTTDSIEKLFMEAKEQQSNLAKKSVNEIVSILDACGQSWREPNSPLTPLRQQGLLFLANWCSGQALNSTINLAMRGQNLYLDKFVADYQFNRRLMRAFPRGVVAHWLAGNVPLLGMLALVQCYLTKNASVLKAASSFSGVLPNILTEIRRLEQMKTGDTTLADANTVIYFDRTNKDAAKEFSFHADARIAWGGREAIEAVLDLPKQAGCEDVFFGPKLSYMVIGKENLATSRQLRKMARRAAVDSSVFDQYACASPHTIFVEKGAIGGSPKEFAAELASQMKKAIVRIPKDPADAGTAGNIFEKRMHYEFFENVWSSHGTEWTVLFDEKGKDGLVDPTYSRVITVRAVDDVMEAAKFASKHIQTVGLGLGGKRKLEFAEKAGSLGAERFPDIGRMTYFDTPWDGLILLDRLVRWVSVGGPF